MGIDRRNFLKLSATAGGATAFASACSTNDGSSSSGSGGSGEIHPLLQGIVPIQDDERRARIVKAQRLMVESNIDAIYMEGGQSMFYFTGVKWGLSERTFSVVIPARGELGYVCPAFEEDRARELIRFGNDVRIWEEHESPYERIAQLLDDRGLRNGTIGNRAQVVGATVCELAGHLKPPMAATSAKVLPGSTMCKTCSLPPAPVLKIRTSPSPTI